ncbi:unnamed protein product [Microthlaspi erraticum]|uniref:Uncharacterized protein n=1 Tax=Microthlaspi erraticum TaxID=1685480 RepID=A0A6D2HYL4_9BRAS|nr:unnamed protein product [Microthlaspi erraticum]
MDFIKTSSLRALIELTFQCKWNGLIWMSRKGVIAKRVKAVQTAISRISANRTDRLAEKRCSALGQNISVRLKSRPKFEATGRSRNTTRETLSRGRPSQTSRHAAHDHAARAGEQASRPRNPFAYHGRCIRPSREITSHVRPRNHRPNLLRPTTPADRETSGPDRSDSATTRLSGRSSRRPSERRGRPEAVFEAQSAQFKPKAGADLARLGLAAFYILRAL